MNANSLLSISNIFNAYVNDGSVILTVGNFLTPGTVGDYSGTTVEVYTAENNLIMSSKDDASNDQVVVSVYTKLQNIDCDGQCRSCGKTYT